MYRSITGSHRVTTSLRGLINENEVQKGWMNVQLASLSLLPSLHSHTSMKEVMDWDHRIVTLTLSLPWATLGTIL